MNKEVVFTETIFSTVAPERIYKIADECLLAIRLVETRRECSSWIYEYEVKGESGKIQKFLIRIRSIEITN
jgi:hypothetical protein